jgi:phospholipid/cholesterol/gamma-HCH transport system substrate-binding protein
MEEKVNFAAVGAFVIVLTVTMIAGVLWLSSGKYYRKSYDTYETYMTESVSGLNVNAPVRYRGVDVGRVRRIALAPGNVEQVQVTLDIERGTPVKEDTVATLQTQGLTGIAYLELMAGHRGSPDLRAKPGEPYPVIASAPSLMNRLETSLPVLLANLNRVSDNVNALLDDENRRAVKATLADLAQLSRTLAARSATIDATLASTARTMDAAARTTDKAAAVADQLPQLVQRIERTAAAFERMATEVAGAGASARGTFDGTRADLAQFTGSTLPEVRALVDELRGLTATLRRVGDTVDRNPSVLLYGRPAGKKGPGE